MLTQELNSIQDLISSSGPTVSSDAPAPAPPPPGTDALLEEEGNDGDQKERKEMFKAVLATREQAKMKTSAKYSNAVATNLLQRPEQDTEQSEISRIHQGGVQEAKEPEQSVNDAGLNSQNSSAVKTPDGSFVARDSPKLSETLSQTPLNRSIAQAWAMTPADDQSSEAHITQDLLCEITEIQASADVNYSAPLVSLVDLDQPPTEQMSRVSSTGSINSNASETSKRVGRKSRTPKYSAPRTPSKDGVRGVRSIKRRPSGSARHPAGLSDE